MMEGIVPKEIREGPAAIRATVDASPPGPRRPSPSPARRAGIRRVHVIGNGTELPLLPGVCRASTATTLTPDDPIVIPMTAGRVPDLPGGPRRGGRHRRHLIVG